MICAGVPRGKAKRAPRCCTVPAPCQGHGAHRGITPCCDGFFSSQAAAQTAQEQLKPPQPLGPIPKSLLVPNRGRSCNLTTSRALGWPRPSTVPRTGGHLSAPKGTPESSSLPLPPQTILLPCSARISRRARGQEGHGRGGEPPASRSCHLVPF